MNDRTCILEEKDKEYIWHPFTQMREWVADTPLIIESGKGSYLIDTQGRRYIDGFSSVWVNIHGHRKKAIDKAITEQLKRSPIAPSSAFRIFPLFYWQKS